ncbi:MAG: serine/threonine-protein kinase [Myxococcota bacterium]
MDDAWLPPVALRDAVQHQRHVAQAEAALFGGTPEPVVIGGYEVGDRLGAGSFGVVYAAYDPSLQRTVALKLLRKSGPDDASVAAAARWVAEARAMARLRDPNVAHVYEVGVDGDYVFIAMEHIVGTTLGAWTRATSRPWTEVLAAYEAAGRGLAAAHAASLVHRDFKPANVLVEGDQASRVVVTDFGLATMRGDDDPPPAVGTVEGTPAYMAPEQRRGEPATAAADQFAFCVALYEALYGQRPFVDDVPGPKPRTPGAAVEVPTLVWSILARGVALDPERRYPSMNALLAALRPEPSVRYRRMVLAGLMLLLAVVLTAAAVQLSMFWDYYQGAADVVGRPPPGQ